MDRRDRSAKEEKDEGRDEIDEVSKMYINSKVELDIISEKEARVAAEGVQAARKRL